MNTQYFQAFVFHRRRWARATAFATTFVVASALISLFVLLSACGAEEAETSIIADREPGADATYRLTFITMWSASLLPTNYPPAAHFSSLTGATHNDQIKFWETGQLASPGIESMAETGSQGAFAAEIAVAKTAGTANYIISGPGNSATGTVIVEFDINQLYPRVTLVSMVAPSPDWFVGVRDLALFDIATGGWKPSLSVKLRVHDAGTDSGLVFTAMDADTQPPEVISQLTSNVADTDFVEGAGPAGEIIATFTFERIK